MSEHTPGPWLAGFLFQEKCGGRSYVPVLRPGNDPVPVAAVHLAVDGYGHNEGRANAHLIASAPDLLLALKTVMGDSDHGQGMKWSERCLLARDAIAKAEGRPALTSAQADPAT